MAVKIIIDSASDISADEAKSLGIEMVPIVVSFGDEEYYDGVNLLPNEFYDKLVKSKVLPKTSLINSFRWEEIFEKYVSSGDEIVVITISSKLSGTYASACQAAEKFEGKVYVVDSLSACAGERLIGLYALQLVNKGMSAADIANELNNSKSKAQVMAVIGTLDYLKKGGRISAMVAFAGGLMNIKPIVAMDDGEVKLVGKAIGFKKGCMQLKSIVESKGGIDFTKPYCAIWSGNDKTQMEIFVKDYAELWGDRDVPSYILGSTIGTHIGPGAVGLAFFTK